MTDSESGDATKKRDGVGSEGTIPADKEGVAAGLTAENSNFNPEEDPAQITGDAADD